MRKRFAKIAFSAALGLAMAFTLSCSSDKDDDNSGGGTTGGNSGTGGNANVVYGADVTYEGETYKTVVIGSQTWFQRNLNYAVAGSKCGDGFSLSDANTATCDTYGRLYDWSTAMALDASCNSSSCASQITTPHRGICPYGWHIPSNADWSRLYRYADGTSDTSSYAYASFTAGRYLKATDGWDDYNGKSGNGTDDYGFSALPGGKVSSDGGFSGVGYEGYWWSSSESDASQAYSHGMLFYSAIASYVYSGAGSRKGSNLHSVRCVKD